MSIDTVTTSAVLLGQHGWPLTAAYQSRCSQRTLVNKSTWRKLSAPPSPARLVFGRGEPFDVNVTGVNVGTDL
jgi:hypothetical protein